MHFFFCMERVVEATFRSLTPTLFCHHLNWTFMHVDSTRIIHSLFKKRAFLPPPPFSCGSEATEMVSGVTQLLSLFITLKVKGKVAVFIWAPTLMHVGYGGTAPPGLLWKCCWGRRATLDVLEEKKFVIMAALRGFWPPCRLSRVRCTPYAKMFSNSLCAIVLNEK